MGNDFWDTSDGENLANSATTEYEQETGNIEPIPDGSNVLAYIANAQWQTDKDMNRYIEIEWAVEQPEQYANRKIWQKLWVADLDPQAKSEEKALAKRDKAKKMLITIDANAGGKLARSGTMPTNDSLVLALRAKQMVIKTMVWSMTGSDGREMSGNWIAGVFPKDKATSVGETVARKPASNASGAAMTGDDIPF